MATSKLLKDILREPLGPYRDHDILSEKTCQMKGGTKLILYSFTLEHNGQVTGLDESERDLPKDRQKDDRRFRFRGILKIANPDWLSDFGHKIVETELNLRANEYAMREGVRVPNLTLNGLFSGKGLTKSNDSCWEKEDEERLMVLIQGEKNIPAVFMRTIQVPRGLLWNTKAHNRQYEVATMDVLTYSLSQKFFGQWGLFALMENMCKRYPYVHDAKKRTPRWFVERYIADFSCPPQAKYQRLIFDDSHSDVDETGRTTTPRHLLRPHMSEILGIFAAHAEWLVTNNEVLRRKLFHITSWKNFAKAVRRQRKEAAQEGVRWGYREGEDTQEGEIEDDGSSGESTDEEMVRGNPVTAKAPDIVHRKLKLAQANADRNTKPSVESDSDPEMMEYGGAQPGVDYASDFSGPSDPGTEEEDDHWNAEEEAISHIPWQLLRPPHLPDIDGRWWCPLEDCDYQLDLHDLTREEEGAIPGAVLDHILQQQWGNAAYDKQVIQGFGHVVTEHYVKHFEEIGIRIEGRDGRTQFGFINNKHRRGGHERLTRGPMPAPGTLRGESSVVPTVHA